MPDPHAAQLVFCNGEPYPIPYTEVEPNATGDLVHRDHYFPSGIRVSGHTPPSFDRISEVIQGVVAGGVPHVAVADVARFLEDQLSFEAKEELVTMITARLAEQDADT